MAYLGLAVLQMEKPFQVPHSAIIALVDSIVNLVEFVNIVCQLFATKVTVDHSQI